jgi:hypothetical protein
MPKPKLSPEGEVIAANGAAMVAAFQVLVSCLEESDALLPGHFLRVARGSRFMPSVAAYELGAQTK